MGTGLYEDLQARELVKQTTDPELGKVLGSTSLSLYCGFDPTADSLHVGSLLPLMTLRRFQLAGHQPIAVVGGATGRIGDPSFKAQERSLLSFDAIEANLRGIRSAIGQVLELDGPRAAKVVDNMEWFGKMSFLDALREIGKHFSVNAMMAKEAVRARLEDRDQGISYTEFSYALLQAYDFHHLHEKEGCRLQIGGSDQWGNITAGCDLIRRIRAAEGRPHAEVYGLTLPLVMKADGTKFGKTESGSVWMDAKKTSSFAFYQFWMQSSDADAIRYLKYFTLLPVDEIAAIEIEFLKAPEKRLAQQTLAREVTRLIHGKEELETAEKATQSLFSGDLRSLTPQAIEAAFADAPRTLKTKSALQGPGLPLLDLLVETQLLSSKGAARKEITAGGIYLNDVRVTDPAAHLGTDSLLSGRFLVLRKGKRHVHLIEFES